MLLCLSQLRCAALAAALACVALVGCSESVSKLTRLVLVADTDMQELEQVRFLVRAPDGHEQSAVGLVRPAQPAYLSMVLGDSEALGPYAVQVEGLELDQVRVTRSAEVSFVRERTLTVLLHLTRDCVAHACSDGLVCALGGCRAPLISEDELIPWPGEPPTLDAGGAELDGGVDAGRQDAAPLDGEVESGTADARGPDAAGTACDPEAPRCQGDSVELCVDGEVTGAMRCQTQDPCKRAICTPGVGCDTAPANDGRSCGPMLTCRGGVCGEGQACAAGSNCRPECGPMATDCSLDCGRNGANCNPACPPNASCAIDCAGTSNCTVTCRGDCAVSCGDASNCRVTCQPGSRCDIDCTGSANCDQTACQGDAACTLRCGDQNNCEFKECTEGDVEECPESEFSCHTDCP